MDHTTTSLYVLSKRREYIFSCIFFHDKIKIEYRIEMGLDMFNPSADNGLADALPVSVQVTTRLKCMGAIQYQCQNQLNSFLTKRNYLVVFI